MKNSRNSIYNSLDSLKNDSNGLALFQSAQQSIVLKNLLSSWHALTGVDFDVGPIKNNEVTLYVANPSALSRIKQSIPSLLQQLRQNGWLVQKIKLKVHSLPSAWKKKEHILRNKQIPKSGLEAFKQLENAVENEEIQAAVMKLNRRHNR